MSPVAWTDTERNWVKAVALVAKDYKALVGYNDWQDGAWWLTWWRENRHRYPDLRPPTIARAAGTARR